MDYSGELIGFEAGFGDFLAIFSRKTALFWLCFLGSYRVKIGFVWSKSVFLGSLPRHEGAIGFLYLGALWFIELIFAKSGQEGKENVLFV